MNVVIVEDEYHTATLLQQMIEADNDFVVTEKLETVVEAVQYLSNHQEQTDLLFFDIQLADGYSFEIFKHIDVTVPVVFCTAYDEYTLQAIKNNGIDYVLKPFKEEEIHSALAKYKRLIRNIRARQPVRFQPKEPKSYQQSFITHYRKESMVVRVEDIALFAVEHETVFLHTFAGEKLPLFKKMEYIESVCDPDKFFRINRQMLVSRAAILSYEPYFNRKICLQLKANLPVEAIVSRLKVAAFKGWLEK